MAGPRANLAVTKDGEAYNKLQRPDHFLDQSAALKQANERKRERGASDTPETRPLPGNKRTKTHHVESMAKVSQPSDDRHQYRSGGLIAECGMRTTLPIDEEEAQYSDDSLGEALAYLRSVRSEASTIPHLLVTSNEPNRDTDNTDSQAPRARTRQHAFYQDGAWISVDESYRATYDESHEPNKLDPQEVYHRQLIKRFEALRHTLSRRGPDETAQLDTDMERSSSGKPPSNRHEWLYTIDREYPTRNRICRLDEKNVRRGLEYCAHAMDRFDTISSQKSCWIWTLLALSGDVGTLDSQKMGHIRDLGNKAGEMSVSLHSASACQSKGTEGDSLHADLADDEQCDEPGAEHILDSETGYVQSLANEDLCSEAEKMHNEALSDSQHGLQSHVSNPGTSGILIDIHESTNTDTNDNTLERARARLLAQLGDNLVQAGIPTSATDTDEAHPHRLAQLDQGLDESQHEIKIRAIPSRVEAERQRQFMRAQDPAAASLRGTSTWGTEISTTMYSVGSDDSLDDIDLNTKITIDMILTVVAECYGQRDLLRFRKPW